MHNNMTLTLPTVTLLYMILPSDRMTAPSSLVETVPSPSLHQINIFKTYLACGSATDDHI